MDAPEPTGQPEILVRTTRQLEFGYLGWWLVVVVDICGHTFIANVENMASDTYGMFTTIRLRFQSVSSNVKFYGIA